MSNKRIKELREQIAALKRQCPAHSVSPAMIQQLDELEEEFERKLKEVGKEKAEPGSKTCQG